MVIGWLDTKVSHEAAADVANGLAAVLAVATVAATARRERSEDRGIEESRERVRMAERDFQEALRVTSSDADVRRIEVDLVASLEDANREATQELLRNLEAASRKASSVEERRDDRPADSSRLTLPALWAVTHSRLDLYHDIATGQARRSFRNAQAAMIIGFVLLVVFVFVALEASTTAGSVVAGGLGAVSAALAGFISRTFIKSQDTAATHLRAYFDQPLEFSRYLAAERLIVDAGLTYEDRAKVLTNLVQAMASPPDAIGDAASGADSSGQQDGSAQN